MRRLDTRRDKSLVNLASSTGFQAFSVLHGITLIAGLVVVIGLLRWGLAERRHSRECGFTRGVAFAGLVFWLLQQSYCVLIERHWAYSLPLHICDLAGLIGPIALLSGWRPLRSTLYFWAFGLTIWGLLTPELIHGPGHLRFWLFWISHCAVMYYALHDCVVLRYRPFAADLGLVCLITLAYLGLLLPLNLANAGWNYAYIGDVDLGMSSPLDVLPAWPWRILGIQVVGAVIFTLVWLPWAVVRRRGDR